MESPIITPDGILKERPITEEVLNYKKECFRQKQFRIKLKKVKIDVSQSYRLYRPIILLKIHNFCATFAKKKHLLYWIYIHFVYFIIKSLLLK